METSLAPVKQLTTRQWAAAASPLVITLIGMIAGHGFAALLGVWAWVGVAVVYWGSLALTIALLGEKDAWKRWIQPSRGRRWWLIVALAIGLMPFPMLLLPNLHLLNSPGFIAMWFVFGVLNPIFEEAYWRGFLLDTLKDIPRPVVVIGSNIIFTAVHPLMWGAFSRPMMVPVFWGITLFMGMMFALMYLSNRSLRLPIFSHFLADLGNLSIFVFMNAIKIPGL